MRGAKKKEENTNYAHTKLKTQNTTQPNLGSRDGGGAVGGWERRSSGVSEEVTMSEKKRKEIASFVAYSSVL